MGGGLGRALRPRRHGPNCFRRNDGVRGSRWSEHHLALQTPHLDSMGRFSDLAWNADG